MTDYPQAYVDYLAHFHGDRDFFECHELLEEYWKKHPDSPHRTAWIGLIQAAVALYHYRRGNIAGAVKSLSNSIRNSDPPLLRELGIDAERWIEQLERLSAILMSDSEFKYEDLNIPLTDESLVERCKARAAESGFGWCRPSDLECGKLIHRHTMRDRSDVIAERRMALERRNAGRQPERSNHKSDCRL